MNRSTNKSHVAIKKIMKYHLNIDISPMFEWDLEGEGNLKALPLLVFWFERAQEAVADDNGGVHYGIHARSYLLSSNLLGPAITVCSCFT